MADPSQWQTLRSAHDDAWRHYEEVASDVHAAYEALAAGESEELPPELARARLADAWERLAESRRQIDHYFTGENGA